MYKNKLLELIKEWLHHNDKLRQINKYLYDHTELFENKYEMDFQTDKHNFFAKKITRYTKEENELIKLLNDKELKELRYKQLIER